MELVGGVKSRRRVRDFSGTLGGGNVSRFGARRAHTYIMYSKRTLESLHDSRQRLAGVARLALMNKDSEEWPEAAKLSVPQEFVLGSPWRTRTNHDPDPDPDCEIGHGERMANA